MHRAKTISIINYKGGVGKTAAAFNIAAGLCYLIDGKTLLIDLDPQCSLTNICLKAYNRRTGHDVSVLHLEIDQTMNYVVRQYLNQSNYLLSRPKIDLNRLILTRFYAGETRALDALHLIPVTMFDKTDSQFGKGLDDLEIEMAMKQVGDATRLNQVSIFARFFADSGLDREYDYIVFDCPPSNSLITQNALVVSDHYLIPTIMDEMSSDGIYHMDSLIQNTMFKYIRDQYGQLISSNQDVPYFDYFRKPNASLLAIFESIKKTRVDTGVWRYRIESQFPGKLLRPVVSNHVDFARRLGEGKCVYSMDLHKEDYEPCLVFGDLTMEILDRLGVRYDEDRVRERVVSTL